MTTDHEDVALIADDTVRENPVIQWALSRVAAPLRDEIEIELITDAEVPAEGYRARLHGGRVTVSASDATGFSYALTELAARLEAARGRVGRLAAWEEDARPAVPLRGIQRAFSSVHEDSGWFHDRRFWTEYLDHVAAQRFNRFHLALGMQHDYGNNPVTDNYLCFAYPFLFDVDGFSVRAEGVDAAERDRNLEALTFIARETKRRGMSFQLGLWNHAYDYAHGSAQLYPILGISDDNHAAYSAAGVRRLLEEIPEIDGLSFRVHYEGGIHDLGHEVFWDAVFQAISDSAVASGRVLQVDMHAKGVDDALREAVAKPGIAPVLSGKHWAEHMGLPYHQATIRDMEGARPVPEGESLRGVTEYTRNFTRYGYGDFLSEDRTIDFMFRMWPGTQRLLLWGDPAIAAGFGRQSTFGGSLGIDYCEPLFFKARKGSGTPGGHDPYVRDDLRLGVDDWKKYRYTYLLWGRLLYQPDADPEVWRRFLVSEYGAAAASAAETALSSLSRILPLFTVAHGVGASNVGRWVENPIYLPVSTRRPSDHYWWDMEQPAVWDTVGALDPLMFSSVADFTANAVAGTPDARYTPLEVANWIEDFTTRGAAALAEFLTTADAEDPQTARTVIDLEVLIRLGRFHASQYRAAVQYGVFERTGSAEAIAATVALVEASRGHWQELVDIVEGVYQNPLPWGLRVSETTHWALQLPRIDDDLRVLRQERDRAAAAGATAAPELALRDRRPWSIDGVSHVRPAAYQRGSSIPIRLDITADADIASAVLHYRHLDQSKTYENTTMHAIDGGFEAEIPGTYTDAPFSIAYFFVTTPTEGLPSIIPGFTDDTLSTQPYHTVASTSRAR